MLCNVRNRLGMKGTGLALALSVISLTAAGQAYACDDGPAPPKKEHAGFTHALYEADASQAPFMKVSDEWAERSAIVGLWEFELRLDGAQNGFPDHFLFDWGLATWHDDGTEIQFSAGRPPSAGDVCMGVWRQVGRREYKLHHIALGLTPPSATGTFVGPAIFRATVRVDDEGDTFTGPFSLTIYPGSPEDGTEFNESGTPLTTFTGTWTAKRVTSR
jgi:hypothetical protein